MSSTIYCFWFPYLSFLLVHNSSTSSVSLNWIYAYVQHCTCCRYPLLVWTQQMENYVEQVYRSALNSGQAHLRLHFAIPASAGLLFLNSICIFSSCSNFPISSSFPQLYNVHHHWTTLVQFFAHENWNMVARFSWNVDHKAYNYVWLTLRNMLQMKYVFMHNTGI